MNKSLSVKELRMNFPKIRKELGKGVGFTVIYRSKPIAQLTPFDTESVSTENKIGNGNRYLPKTMDEFLKNFSKFNLGKGVKIDAVKLIRKERGYEK
jgi:antitoxin (DNA-binding transcriptional repressor) of toxin-antitoxin stability system